VEELSELLDEGAMHGGQLLTRRAVAAADLVELQRISDRFERQGGLTASFSRRSTSGIPAGDAAPAGYRDPHALDRATGARGMIDDMSTTPDRETLRALADEGNEKALDRLADLADERGDVEELSELLDEGAMHAGQLLTRRAVAARDLMELQRIADAGYERAAAELDRLLTRPGDLDDR